MEISQYNGGRLCVERKMAKWPLLENVVRDNGQKRQLFLKSSIVVLFSHKMSSHAKLRPPTTHLMDKSYVNVVMTNLVFIGVVVDHDEVCKDKFHRLWVPILILTCSKYGL